MGKVISCCGLDCATCDARIATLADDNDLRFQTAEKWRIQFNAENITSEMINCTGCREEGVKFAHCYECEIRLCADSKNFVSCSECDELTNCKIIAPLHQYVPEALVNLKSLINN